jgi:hypothetical protein
LRLRIWEAKKTTVERGPLGIEPGAAIENFGRLHSDPMIEVEAGS